MTKVFAIAAMNENRVIGDRGGIPWHFPEDMKRFSALTKGHAVLMGRKTFDSLPPRFKPLPERLNLVSTSKPSLLPKLENVNAVASPVDAITDAKRGRLNLPSDLLWIIGGAEVYRQTMPMWDEVFLTLVNNTVPGDAFFPEFEDEFREEEREVYENFSFVRFVRVKTERPIR